MRPPAPHLRVYEILRTAHLERFAARGPSDVLYQHTRYDFDQATADRVQGLGTRLTRTSRLGVLKHLALTSHQSVELNEPMMSNRWIDLGGQLLAIRLRDALTGRHTRISAYCIGIVDPAHDISARRRLPLGASTWWTRTILRALVRGFDCLAFGTTGSYLAHAELLDDPELAVRARTFEALPAACECLAEEGRDRDPAAVVFVGSFDERKGVRLLMHAWEVVHRDRPDATLHLMGTGPLSAEVTSWAAGRAEVSVALDPPRGQVHEGLSGAATLVLLSQRVGHWREQVGLPLVEGLAHGCQIVTTTESGLSPWLAEHGHRVVAAPGDVSTAAAAVLAALQAGRSRASVLADLPSDDQRLAAEDWMTTGDEPGHHPTGQPWLPRTGGAATTSGQGRKRVSDWRRNRRDGARADREGHHGTVTTSARMRDT